MRDATTLLMRYRECSRSIWNNHFLANQDCTFDDFDRFQWICRRLFQALVLTKLGLDMPIENIGREPISAIQINSGSTSGVPIMINRESGESSGYWDHPLSELLPGQAELVYVDFFDWSVLTYLDFQYYLVFIQSFKEQPDLVGRYALIEVLHAKPILMSEPRCTSAANCTAFT